MKKIITTVALALAAISAAHGVIGDNPLQLAAHFKTKPIVVEQVKPRTIKVVYVEDGWITLVTLVDGISKAELMARADNGLVGYEDMEAQVAHYGGKFEMWKQDKPWTEDLFTWVAARWEAVFRSRQDDPSGRQEIQLADPLRDPGVARSG